MDEDECIHGLGPVSACTVCNGKDRKQEPEWSVFPTKYEYLCPVCIDLIKIGDMIAWRSGEQSRHEACT